MARIAGVNIPQDKVVHIALTYIHGIGNFNSKLICEKLNIPLNKRVNKLSEEEVLKIANQEHEIVKLLSRPQHEVGNYTNSNTKLKM